MKTPNFLAFDLGAESGRVILGSIKTKRLTITEIHRFPNRMIRTHGHCQWDLERLFGEIKAGIKKCVQEYKCNPQSLGIDTWGVDFGLLDDNGALIGNPYAYRDPQTRGMVDRFSRRISRKKLYRLTGIQFHEINSLYQLAAIKRRTPSWFGKARHLLFMPDLFNYLLTGIRASEYTIASTSQMMDARTKTWAPSVLRALGIPRSLMPGIVNPGLIIGRLKKEIAEELRVPMIPVVAVAGHDTASAIAAVPAQSKNWAFISCGTWSLMGVETIRPIINRRTRLYNFTNEGGIGGRIRFLKNIAGLWLLRECRRSWSRKKRVTYEMIDRWAAAAEPLQSFLDPDRPEFLMPDDMALTIRNFYRRTGQKIMRTHGAIARSILESLAFKYRWALNQLAEIVGDRIQTIHIVGGGSRNRLLCQFTANATGLPVVSGPVEATAVGNILAQAIAAGLIKSLAQARAVVRRSFPLETYDPVDRDQWSEKYQIFLAIAGK